MNNNNNNSFNKTNSSIRWKLPFLNNNICSISSCHGIPLFVIKATAIASLGGVLFGYDTGIIEGALSQVSTEFSLSMEEQEWCVGILYLGGGFGAAVGGILCDSLGRKRTILITDAIFVCGAVLLSVASNYLQFMFGRVVIGFAISVSGIADVAYLHEMAPPKWRGSIVSVNEGCISLGFLVAFLFAALFDTTHGGWRYMFGTSGVLALLQFIMMITSMPESPVWLRQKGRIHEEELALRKIYGADNNANTATTEVVVVPSLSHDIGKVNVYNEEESIEQTSFATSNNNHYHSNNTTTTTTNHQSFLHVFQKYSIQCWIALFLSIAQQFSGQASILSYAKKIFSDLDDSDSSVFIWMGTVKFLTTVLVICSIERLGRRFLLLCGMFTIVIGQFLVAFAFSIDKKIDNDEDTASTNNQSAMICAFVGILGVVSGYSASFGPLTWLITSELFPTDIRGRALGASTIVTYVCASLVTTTFLSLENAVGDNNVFLFYGLITLLSMVFVILAIPETGGKKKSVEEIHHDLLPQMWLWRKVMFRQKRGEIVQAEEEAEGYNSNKIKPIQLEMNEIVPSSSMIQVHNAELT